MHWPLSIGIFIPWPYWSFWLFFLDLYSFTYSLTCLIPALHWFPVFHCPVFIWPVWSELYPLANFYPLTLIILLLDCLTHIIWPLSIGIFFIVHLFYSKFADLYCCLNFIHEHYRLLPYFLSIDLDLFAAWSFWLELLSLVVIRID